jgi:hypothetical protein
MDCDLFTDLSIQYHKSFSACSHPVQRSVCSKSEQTQERAWCKLEAIQSCLLCHPWESWLIRHTGQTNRADVRHVFVSQCHSPCPRCLPFLHDPLNLSVRMDQATDSATVCEWEGNHLQHCKHNLPPPRAQCQHSVNQRRSRLWRWRQCNFMGRRRSSMLVDDWSITAPQQLLPVSLGVK